MRSLKIFKFHENLEILSSKRCKREGAKVCQSCRSRKMLKNDYLLAKIGFDTAENEPSKVWTCLPAPSPPLIQLRMYTHIRRLETTVESELVQLS